jgi:16S rRNA processing protein RimM
MAQKNNRDIRNTLIEAGFVKKSHGVKGGLLLHLNDEIHFNDEEPEFLFLEVDGLPVPFPIEYLEERDSPVFYAELGFLNNKENVQRYLSCKVFFETKNLAIQSEQVGVSALIGWYVRDSKYGKIGTVSSVDDFSGNIVLTVNGEKGEFLIPYNEHLLVSLDAANSTLEMNCPEGIFE